MCPFPTLQLPMIFFKRDITFERLTERGCATRLSRCVRTHVPLVGPPASQQDARASAWGRSIRGAHQHTTPLQNKVPISNSTHARTHARTRTRTHAHTQVWRRLFLILTTLDHSSFTSGFLLAPKVSVCVCVCVCVCMCASLGVVAIKVACAAEQGRVYTYIRSYIHPYIHTYIHTYMHTYKGLLSPTICVRVRVRVRMCVRVRMRVRKCVSSVTNYLQAPKDLFSFFSSK